MGIALIVPGVDFSSANLGRVTLQGSVPLISLNISGPDSIRGTEGQYLPIFTPANTTQRGVSWSVVSGSTYASINSSTGVVTVLSGADDSPVTIRATSTFDSSIYAEKTITVTYAQIVYYDYIESDGACYFVVDGLISLYGGEVVARTTLTTNNGYTISSSYASNSTATRWGLYKRNAGDIGVCLNGSFIATNVNPVTNKIYRIRFKLQTSSSSSDGSATIYDDATDTQLFTRTNSKCYINADIALFTFGYNNGGCGTEYYSGPDTLSANKFYGFVVKDSSDNTVRDVRPCTVNDRPAVIDVVEGKIYYNLGSGTPSVGNDSNL